MSREEGNGPAGGVVTQLERILVQSLLDPLSRNRLGTPRAPGMLSLVERLDSMAFQIALDAIIDRLPAQASHPSRVPGGTPFGDHENHLDASIGSKFRSLLQGES